MKLKYFSFSHGSSLGLLKLICMVTHCLYNTKLSATSFHSTSWEVDTCCLYWARETDGYFRSGVEDISFFIKKKRSLDNYLVFVLGKKERERESHNDVMILTTSLPTEGGTYHVICGRPLSPQTSWQNRKSPFTHQGLISLKTCF